MNNLITPYRSANAALAATILAGAIVPAFDKPGLRMEHGLITTANDSFFTQAHFSEPMTNYATGWVDPGGYDEMIEFLAPALPPSGERYEHITYPNAEAFLSDGSYDDLRPINSDFPTVDYSQGKTSRTIPNRGLRIVLDWDRIKNQPNWQQFYTSMLMQRIQRNAFRRKYALGVASATNQAVTWDSSADPDYDLAYYAQASGDTVGVTPNRAIVGISADLLRFQAYGASNTPKGYAGRVLSIVEALAKRGIAAKISEQRYQSSAAAKSRIVGSLVLLFAGEVNSMQDRSNFKTARGVTQAGGRWGVYVRQISTKLWEVVVECYETEYAMSTLGVRTLTVS